MVRRTSGRGVLSVLVALVMLLLLFSRASWEGPATARLEVGGRDLLPTVGFVRDGCDGPVAVRVADGRGGSAGSSSFDSSAETTKWSPSSKESIWSTGDGSRRRYECWRCMVSWSVVSLTGRQLAVYCSGQFG